MLPGTTGLHQFATGTVEIFPESEVGYGGAPRCSAPGGARSGGCALADAKIVTNYFNPFFVFLVQCFTWNGVDLNVCIKSHAYLSLAIIFTG
ncbi:hypothetical protein D3C76_1303320 [compost metagenome]